MMAPGVLTDDAGNPSSMRWAMIFFPALIVGTWCAVCLWNRKLEDFPVTAAAIVMAFIAGKVVQKPFETKPQPCGPTAPTGIIQPSELKE